MQVLRSLLSLLAAFSLLPLVATAQDSRPSDRTASTARAAADAQVWILTNLTLLDGTDAPARAGVSVVLEGKTIRSITDGPPSDAPPDAQWVDLSGHFAVPGLHDVHTHLATSPSAGGYTERVQKQLRHLLGRGVTAVRDMAGDARVLAYLARQTGLGDLPGPDIHFAAVVGGSRLLGDPRLRDCSLGVPPGTAPWAHCIREETDLSALMHEIRGTGASGVKIYADLSPELLRCTIDAAKERGLMVWAHWVVTPRRTGALEVVRAGVDVVSHVHLPLLDTAPDDRVSSARALSGIQADVLLKELATRGTILDATLIAAQGLPSRPGWVEPGVFAIDLLRAARAAGVLIATGSDHRGDDQVPGIHLEYRALVRDADWTPAQVIEAATSVSARVLGTAARSGSLREGMEATLLVLDRDPSKDLTALAEPRFVLKRGRLYSGEELRGEGPSDGSLDAFPGAQRR